MALEEEQKTYERELPNLLTSAGRFVVIHGSAIEGVYDTYGDALKVAYEKFGLSPFLVQEIEPAGQAHYFTRDLPPCRT